MKMIKRLSLALAASALAGAALAPLPALAETSLPQSVQDALTAALMDEWNAEAFYSAVLDAYGQVRPFTNIIRAERQHASYIIDLMQTYGMDVPENTLLGSSEIAAAVPASFGDVCALGVEAEIANAGLYDDKLLPAVAGYADIEAVFVNLRDASQQMHLPAFQRCAV